MDSCINRPDACDPGCRGLFVDGDQDGRICRCDECARFDGDESALIHALTCGHCREAMVVMIRERNEYIETCHRITEARKQAGDARVACYTPNDQATAFYGAPCYNVHVYTYKRQITPDIWGIACVDGTAVRLMPHGGASC